MANVFLSIPILDKPELKMMHSLWQSIATCREHRVRMYFNENDSLISRVRNAHISMFLDEYKECDYFMSIDSDIEIVNCYPTNNIFTKLIAHDKDFVGALYALKKDGPPKCSSIAENSDVNFKFDSGLVEMKWLSSGCWCIKRSAVEAMAKKFPELVYDGDDNMAHRKLYGLYIPFIKEMTVGDRAFKKYLSEDWAFNDRWRSMGGKIYADTSIVLKHTGKHQFSLWNVEVVTQRKEDSPPQPVASPAKPEEKPVESSPKPLPLINTPLVIAPLPAFEKVVIPPSPPLPQSPSLPRAGFDLKKGIV